MFTVIKHILLIIFGAGAGLSAYNVFNEIPDWDLLIMYLLLMYATISWIQHDEHKS